MEKWENIENKKYTVRMYDLTISNIDEFFNKNIIGAQSYEQANKVLDDIITVNIKYSNNIKIQQEKRKRQSLKAEIKKKLNSTMWSMLPDAPLSQNGKKLYREYRQYLRDIPELWDNKQIKELEVMSFDEWRKDPPVYKVVKKEIL